MNTAVTPTEHPVALSIPAHRLSVVVPMYNEAENVAPLAKRVHEALLDYPHPWELLLVDDGSSDGTPGELEAAARHYGPHVRVVSLMRNFKQTAAMQAGVDAARGDVIVTMDGDLQNDPIDIPRMVGRLLNENLDLVAGWRKNRKDGMVLRKIPSRIANRLIARITGVKLNDYGCSLKAFRASVIKNVRLYGEMHRFIPAWLATVTTPRRIAEEVVTHHARQFGQSKYGISRTFRVILDLIFVFFFMRYRARPGHFFGGIGLAVGVIGSAILGWLAALKLFTGASIGQRPLLQLGFFLIIAAVQFISTGVLAETLARIYFESGGASQYRVRDPDAPDEDDAWHKPGQALPE
ncbi:glycosyltransferase family 2 protein [Niveibacterium sp. 24ML]|uniref:glycosyltransferase family 2 protein n=1 Tax=Niveibacterium sp. 24ML TaxID=2985512 RepID=UPI00226D4E5C|nr:glycosyltransferase family 2 protein [Niveibacterium sp. 24ML]MCX9156579.1 glycosyltransferase family 2 protein [Niveibacterium sp. 24ML]